MKKQIYSNIEDLDALESFFECITSCSINSEGVDCTTACYVKHLEPNNAVGSHYSGIPLVRQLEKTKCMIFNKTGRLIRRDFFVGKNKLENVDGMKSFDESGYLFDPDLSTDGKLVFTRDQP